MKLLLAPILFSALLLGACSNPPQSSESAPQADPSEATEATVWRSTETAPKASHGQPVELFGKVLETMQSGGYTYALLNTDKGQVWTAGSVPKLAVGDQVIASELTPMRDFPSSTLDRTFEMIYFCNKMRATGAQSPVEEVATAPVQVEKAEGEQTVEQMFTGKEKFVGKQVTLRGRVVKFSAAIMGKNWIHLQDGSGGEGTNDLTITTDQTVVVGDAVTVVGILVADKDFGYGYKYALIIEDAQVTVD
ncbi:MAG: hypothetical protein GY930_06570 [bacterium]|nr:hypothetical protein [bacterium]